MQPLSTQSSLLPKNESFNALNSKIKKFKFKIIDFPKFVSKLTHLPSVLKNKASLSFAFIKNYINRMLSATLTVFSHMIFSPSFNPHDPAVKLWLKNAEEKLPSFDPKIKSLSEKFKFSHQISDDLDDLKKLQMETTQILDKLKEYSQKFDNYDIEFPVQDQLKKLKKSYHKIVVQIDDYYHTKAKNIFELFKEILVFFKDGKTHVPKGILNQLKKTWEDLTIIHFIYSQSHKEDDDQLAKIKKETDNILEAIKNEVNGMDIPSEVAPTLHLRNSNNSCYMDSFLESLFCMDYVRTLFEKTFSNLDPLIYEEKFIAVIKEVQKLLSSPPPSPEPKKKTMSQMEYILYLFKGENKDNINVNSLREAVFEANLHPEYNNKKYIHDPHDAYIIAEIFLNHFLTDCRIKTRGHATTPIFPGLEFLDGGNKGKDEVLKILQLSLQENKNQKLKDVLKGYFENEEIIELDQKLQRKFDPSNAIVKDSSGQNFQNSPATKVIQYTKWTRLTELPPVLTIQIKRFNNEGKKIDCSVALPEDGIVDFTEFYDAPSGEKKEAKYRIKSMVRHQGASIGGGHYVSEVEIKEKYYHCDDGDKKPTEISQENFFDHDDAYLLFLEKI